jgi:hypothetical protein
MDANGGTLSLGSLVSTYEKLEVDDYQRPYTWTKDEIEELFADLDDCVRDKTPHFFGTLILQQVSDKHVKVVDGQQRLTTSFIMVAALRDELLSLPVRTISGGTGHVEVYVPQKVNEYLLVDNQVDRHRFSPNRTIRELMQTVVMAAKADQRAVPKRDRSQGETTLKFRKAVTHIRKTISEDLAKSATDEEKLVRINELLEALLKRFHLLRVLTSDDAESLDIFLTLNNRGVPLGPSDLVRGEVLKRLGANLIGKPLNDLHKANLSEWNAISEAVKEPEAFLRHYLVSISDEKVQKKKVVDAVMKVLRSNGPSTEQEERAARKFWGDLKDAAENYGKIVTPFTSDLPKNSAKCYLVLLNGLMKSHRILLLNILPTGLDDDDLDETVRLLFVFGFAYYINGGNAQDLENDFQTWGRSYSKSKNLGELQGKLIEGIKKNPIDAAEYFSGEADGDFVTRALLYAINHKISTRTWPLSEYHLEHIAPQTTTEWWNNAIFGDPEGDGDAYEELVSRLGNLTLLDPEKNWKIKNWPWFDPSRVDKSKKTEYSGASTIITDELRLESKWDADDIELRSEWLIEMFSYIWSEDKDLLAKVKRYTDWRASR